MGVRKATGSYRTYSISSKTAALAPKFAVEYLPSAELQPMFLCFQWRICLWAEHSDDDDDDDDNDSTEKPRLTEAVADRWQ